MVWARCETLIRARGCTDYFKIYSTYIAGDIIFCAGPEGVAECKGCSHQAEIFNIDQGAQEGKPTILLRPVKQV